MAKKRSEYIRGNVLIIFALLTLTFSSALTGCKDKQSVTLPINNKVTLLKKNVKKEFSKGLKINGITHKRLTSGQVTNKASLLKIENAEKNKIKMVRYRSKFTVLRDPFIPFIKFNKKSSGQRANKPLLPLQRYKLSQLTLVAIIDAGKAGRWAMVQDSSGKGFTIKKGVAIGREGGTVKEILPDSLIIEQVKIDLLGEKKTKLIKIKLHPEKKGD